MGDTVIYINGISMLKIEISLKKDTTEGDVFLISDNVKDPCFYVFLNRGTNGLFDFLIGYNISSWVVKTVASNVSFGEIEILTTNKFIKIGNFLKKKIQLDKNKIRTLSFRNLKGNSVESDCSKRLIYYDS